VNHNPYAPPGAEVPGAATVPYGQPQPWTAGEALTLAWARFKEFAPVLVLAYLLNLVLSIVVGQAGNIVTFAGGLRATSAAGLLTAAGGVLGQIVAAYLQVGMTRIVLDAARGKAPDLGTLFAGGGRFLPLFLVNLLFGLAILLGLVFLIVPGIIIGIRYSLAPFYVVDAGMGPVEAMKASWSATRGQKGEIFVLWLAAAGISVLGMLMCCVGLLATGPIVYVAMAVAFIRMSGLGVTAPLTGPQGQEPAAMRMS
jgi:hypothetical protein